jgi:hypothetical protein
MFTPLQLTSIGFQEFILAMIMFWIPGYFIARAILKRTSLREHLKLLSVILGFVLAPILLGLTIWVVMAVTSP